MALLFHLLLICFQFHRKGILLNLFAFYRISHLNYGEFLFKRQVLDLNIEIHLIIFVNLKVFY